MSVIQTCRKRRGAIIPLSALLMVFLLGMVAFSVDLGYIVVTRAEMQKAADAAALAGASQLLVPQIPSPINADTLAAASVTAAIGQAQAYCKLNKAGTVSLDLLGGDIIAGYLPPIFDYDQNPVAWQAGQPFPNAVKATVRRDGTANTPLGLFFARVIGNPTWNGQVSATAMVSRSYNVTGFNSRTRYGLLLPIAVDVNLWNAFLANGRSPDGQIHDSYTAPRPAADTAPPANVTLGGDKVAEFTDTYPNKTAPGNFGLVSIGPPATDRPTFTEWILNGPSPADFAYFGEQGLRASAASPKILDAGPGMKSPVQADLQAIIGQPRAICLYSAYEDNGSNAIYQIVGFAGVTVVEATARGTNMQIVVQPMAVIDPTATYDEVTTGPSTQMIYPTSPLTLVR